MCAVRFLKKNLLLKARLSFVGIISSVRRKTLTGKSADHAPRKQDVLPARETLTMETDDISTSW